MLFRELKTLTSPARLESINLQRQRSQIGASGFQSGTDPKLRKYLAAASSLDDRESYKWQRFSLKPQERQGSEIRARCFVETPIETIPLNSRISTN